MTPAEYFAAVAKVDPLSPKYLRRDVTGDGIPETFCNAFVCDVADELAIPLPRKLANDLIGWLGGEDSSALGWLDVDGPEAFEAARRGQFTLATWRNPSGHGHLAVLVPSVGPELQIAQAGTVNFIGSGIARGFGSLPTRFFTRQS